MELSNETNGVEGALVLEPSEMKERLDMKKVGKSSSKTDGKQALTVAIAASVKISGKKKEEEEKASSVESRAKTKPRLEESQNKTYSFSDFDVPCMLEHLLEFKLIKLPLKKRLQQGGRMNDPNYLIYIGQPMQTTFDEYNILI